MISGDPRSPAVQLRRLLCEAREQGLEFSEAWVLSLRRVKWPHDTAHRIEWKKILGDGKDFVTPEDTLVPWRSAYHREAPTRADRTIALLAA